MDLNRKKSSLLYFFELFSLLLFMALSMALEYLPPHQRIPDLNDRTISFPHTKYEIVSGAMLPLFNMVIPTIFIISIATINRFRDKKMFIALLGLYFSVSLAFLITNLFKSPVGRLRPDFLSRCNPLLDSGGKFLKCSGNLKLVQEGRRSFPSGHSSSSFSGLGFVALLLADRISLFSNSRKIYKFVVFILPLICAALVAISRIIDYRHHWDDVLVGGIIGCTSACFSYFYFYPLLSKPAKDETQSSEGIEVSIESQKYSNQVV